MKLFDLAIYAGLGYLGYKYGLPLLNRPATPGQQPAQQQPVPAPSQPVIGGQPASGGYTREQIMARVKQHLADAGRFAYNTISELAADPVEWPDTSLGCPTPGLSNAQIRTMGWRIILSVGSRQYEYHTDLHGNFVLCNR